MFEFGFGTWQSIRDADIRAMDSMGGWIPNGYCGGSNYVDEVKNRPTNIWTSFKESNEIPHDLLDTNRRLIKVLYGNNIIFNNKRFRCENCDGELIFVTSEDTRIIYRCNDCFLHISKPIR